MIALRLEAILVGDVVERDHLAVGSCPCDGSLDGELLVLRAEIVHDGRLRARNSIAGLIAAQKKKQNKNVIALIY